MEEELKELVLQFHNTYEELAPKFGYETRKDTREFDFNSNNGKLMYATIEKVVKPILNRLEQLEQENKELKEAKKSMREKLHNAHRAWVKWERKAIQAKQVFEQKKTECKQLTKVLGEKNRKIKELEQANIRRAEDEFEALSWEE